jgi:hypothetical protein
MLGSQLMKLIKALSKRDRRELRKVVHSPYFNQRPDVTALYEYIDKNLEGKSPNFSKESVFKTLFPVKKYDDVLIRQVMSYLYQTIQKYLITEGVLNNESDSQVYLTRILRQRGMDRLYEKKAEETLQFIDNQSFKNNRYHYLKYLLRAEEYEHKSRKQRSGEYHLQSLSDELDNFYIAERLRQACIMYAHQTIAKREYGQPLLPAVLQEVEQMTHRPPSVSAYYHTYYALTEPENEHHFQQLKKVLAEKGHLFPDNEHRDLYLFAANYCIKRLNNGEKKFGTEALTLYRTGLEKKVLLENGILLHYVYKNIHMLALKAEQYTWAEHFLRDFKIYLPEYERENLYQYNMALFHFRIGNYDEAMLLLQQVNLNDVLYNLDARRLLARIYFEKNEMTALDSLIESSKIYLYRQKNIGYTRDMYLNFFKYLEKMNKSDVRLTEIRAQLRGEISGTQLLAEKEWLLEKLL